MPGTTEHPDIAVKMKGNIKKLYRIIFSLIISDGVLFIVNIEEN
jgi:hypothetical protein